MTIFALIAALTSTLALVIVATGILALSVRNLLKASTDKSVGVYSRAAPAAPNGGGKSEAKMPSIATLYVA